MPVATARTITLQGAVGHLIDVQVDVSQGMVGTTLVGRPDAAINEGRDRCRMAIQNSSLEWPTTRRVTILLSPADVPKSGPHFDLAMAVAVLGASGGVASQDLDRTVFIGELTLDGRLRPVPGVLPMAMAAAARGVDRVFVPELQAREAALVPGMTVFGMRSLAQVVAELSGEPVPWAPPVEPMSGSPLLSWRGERRIDEVDLSEVKGMADARFAIEVAAAGGHHLLLSGPKGAGKTTLAERIPGIMPDLTVEEGLELAAIHSLAGVLEPGDDLLSRPPFSAPHSSSTRASLLGGGTGKVRPGDISRAHCGVLFMDEFPLFNSDIVEALRQPLESGEITIGRGDETATYPARGMFVFACNPCPCRHPPRAHTTAARCASSCSSSWLLGSLSRWPSRR
jgi:magnesium chelatase family protein